jgi:hypothetical protein
MNIKTKTQPLQSLQADLTPEQLYFVAGGGLLPVWGPGPEESAKEAAKQAERLLKPFRDLGHAISSAVSYVGNKIGGFFSSVF